MKRSNILLCLFFTGLQFSLAAQFHTTLPKPGEANINNSQTLNVTQIRESGHIQVTTPRYDNIGPILNKIDFTYSNYAPEQSPYMIFMNCGTSTKVDPTVINDYVTNGGVLYASDLSEEILIKAFPGLFEFEGRNGSIGEIEASIEDADLREVIGNQMEVHFDLKGWAVLKKINDGKVLLRAVDSGWPLMVEVPYGDGRIFYTCFHNHQQASAKEEALLQLLITKQVNSIVEQDFAITAEQMGLDLQAMKLVFKN